mmetsp:Transcript_13137/g.15197  ORF Transcript_13137/g.15197 Transcript_13137/m.15197 type:complete len:89 (+) Transcript_13137:252-518(+)
MDERNKMFPRRPRRNSSQKVLFVSRAILQESIDHLVKRPTIRILEECLRRSRIKMSSDKVLTLMHEIESRKRLREKKKPIKQIDVAED